MREPCERTDERDKVRDEKADRSYVKGSDETQGTQGQVMTTAVIKITAGTY